MKFTDIFIRRPVLASVVSLVILVVGLRSFSSLQVLAYPKTENGVVTISTSFPGADPDAIAGFITTPIEAAVAQANGIDYMTSTSQSSTSTITVYLRQNYDTSKAAAEINIKVNSVLNQLPTGTLQPAISVKVGQTIDAMFIGFTSQTLASNQITDYLTRVVQPSCRRSRACRRPRSSAARPSRCAPGSIPKKLAGLRHDGERRGDGLGEQRLHLRGRQHQGSDDPGHADLDHEPAFPRANSAISSSNR